MKSLSLNRNKLNIGQVFKVANVSLYVLAAICFMVYATNNYTHAEDNDEDLGYDIKSADASVTVGTACTFTATVDSAHNANISNGIYSTNIGKTTLNTICNDSGGYAVYAIGYTGDEYGATNLSSDISSTYNISTGTSTSGDSSSWAMKLAPEPGTTTATIENGYNNYNIVPDDYTKVATLNTITDNTSASSVTGSSISTTYQTYISPTQPAGTYTGKVKYTLVHPSTSPKPEIPVYMQDIATIKSKLINVGDTMQAIDSRDEKKYWITKLADGNIWMTQNLDFDIVDGGANINSTNTDVPVDWADAGDLTNTHNDTTWKYTRVAPESYNPGNLYWDGVLDTSWEGNLSNNTTTNPSSAPGGTHYHIGNYYNWTAAVAMSNSTDYASSDINQSICPAGWRLPTYSGNKSYQNLVNKEKLVAGTSSNVQNPRTYFTYGGEWAGNSDNVGSSGVYWSSASSTDYGYVLFFNVSEPIYTQWIGYRIYGYSIRCVAR